MKSGEVVMTSVYNGRIFAANNADKTNFAIDWDAGFIYQIDSWVILANSPNKDKSIWFAADSTKVLMSTSARLTDGLHCTRHLPRGPWKPRYYSSTAVPIRGLSTTRARPYFIS